MATGRNFNTYVTINGVNNLSGPIGRGVDKSISSLEKLSNRMRASSYAAFQIGQTFAATAAGFAAPLVYAGRQAVMFEDKMADVAKVTNTAVGSEAFKAMGEEVKGLSVYLGRSATESADLFTTLAQGGTAVKDLNEIARLAGRVAVAFDVSTESAGSAFSRIQNVLNITTAQTSVIADAINALSNTRNAKASEILTFMSAGGVGVAQMSGTTGKDIAAIGATLRATVTPSAEEAATVMERMYKAIVKSASLKKTFDDAGRGAAGFVAVLNKGLVSKNPDAFFLKFGEYGNQIAALARGMDGPKGLAGALRLVKDESVLTGSVMSEFQNKQATTLSYLKRSWAELQVAVIDFGNNVIPVLRDTVDWLKPVVAATGAWVKQNPELSSSLVKVTASLAVFSGGVAALSFLFGGLFTAIRAGTAVIAFFSTGIGSVLLTKIYALGEPLAYAALRMGALTSAGLAAAASITGVGAAVVVAYNTIPEFEKAVDKLGIALQSLADHGLDALGALLMGDFDKFWKISAAADLQTQVNYDSYLGNKPAAAVADAPTGGFDPLGPRPAPLSSIAAGTKQLMTQSINYSPTINFGNPVAEGSKQLFEGILKRDKFDLEMKLKEIERDKERRALAPK